MRTDPILRKAIFILVRWIIKWTSWGFVALNALLWIPYGEGLLVSDLFRFHLPDSHLPIGMIMVWMLGFISNLPWAGLVLLLSALWCACLSVWGKALTEAQRSATGPYRPIIFEESTDVEDL